jgi:hypothetical protein
MVRWIFTRVVRTTPRNAAPAPAAAAALVMFLAATATSAAFAAAPPAKQGRESKYVVQVVEPPKPVTIPSDAIIIPYDPDKRTAADAAPPQAEKLIIPYGKYVELWNRAYPDKKLEATPPPADYALAGAAYRAELSGEESLTLDGQIDIELFTDKPVAVPLPLSGGVLTRALVDGKPALLKATAPVAPAQSKQSAGKPGAPKSLLLLHIQGRGRKRLDVAVRLKLTREGGQRIASGHVPHAPATALTLTVPTARTEVRLGGVLDQTVYETEADGEQIETALAVGQPLSVRWQPKVDAGEVDRSLTVDSDAVLDVREDGLRLAWRLLLKFPNSLRESFSITVPPGPPDGYIIEKVLGDNVRGWERRDEEGGSRIEVTLLKAVEGSETITVQLSRQQQLLDDEPVDLQVPTVNVAGAALHRGSLTVRRSPLLEVRISQLEGLTRDDVPADAVAALTAADGAQESPLGIRNYQAYRFNDVPFTLAAAVAPVPTKRRAELRSKVIIADLETRLDTRITILPEGAPVYRIDVAVPDNLSVDRVTAPGSFEWSVSRQDNRKVVGVYLAAGQEQPFTVAVFGKLTRDGPAQAIAIPRLDVLNVDEQEGDIVFLADPAFDVKPETLDQCQRTLLVQVRDWIDAQQLSSARLALHYSSPDYAGTVRPVPRQPKVECVTVTNVKVGDERIEETILLEYTITVAGIKQVSFLIPKRLERARIAAPAIRQQTMEPAALPPAEDGADGEQAGDHSHVRVTLDLQEEMMGQFSVRIEYDRLADGLRHTAPLPVVEDVENVQRFVTMQYAGFHDPVVARSPGIERLSRQQSPFRQLAEILGSDAVEGYSVAGNDRQTQFAYTTEIREVVETAGARIGLAETQLAVDSGGTFHARTVLKVHNTTEQYLEIRLPQNSRLWTAEVAGRPVKPTEVPGAQNSQDVRIPLRKTQKGDADYDVALTYGGSTRILGTARSTPFPIARVQNINIERSQVRLYLPRDRQWFWFGGSMQRTQEAEYQADYLGYLGEELDLVAQALRSKNPYHQARALGNLKGLKSAMESHKATYGEYAPNAELERNYAANTAKMQEIERLVQQAEVTQEESAIVDNRERLRQRWRSQKATRARNVIQDVEAAPVTVQDRQAPAPTEQQRLNRKWLDFNQLENPNEDIRPDQAARLNLSTPVQPVADLVLPTQPQGSVEGRPGADLPGQAGEPWSAANLPAQLPAGGQPRVSSGQAPPAPPYAGKRPAQPLAAGVQMDLNGDDYTKTQNGFARNGRGEWESDQGGDLLGRARRYQEKLEQQAEREGKVAAYDRYAAEIAEQIRQEKQQVIDELTESRSRMDARPDPDQPLDSELAAAGQARQRELVRRLAELEERSKRLIGRHKEEVSSLSFSFDGSGRGTADSDETVELWLADGGEIEGEAAPRGGIAGRAVDRPTRLPPGYASLTVDLVFDGKEYVFTSPRQGDINARSVRGPVLNRLWRIGGVVVALLALLVLYRLARYIGAERLTGYAAATVLLLAGLLSVCGGIFPVAGLLAVPTALVLYIRRATRRRPRTTASNG